MKIQFGKKYRDSVTGLEGIATGIAEYQYGCKRVLLEKLGKDSDGNPLGLEFWFDEQRLVAKSKARAGGPSPTPSMRSIPTRR